MDETRSQSADLNDLGSLNQGSVSTGATNNAAGLYSSDMNKYYLDSSLEVKQPSVVVSPDVASQPIPGQRYVGFKGISRHKAVVVSAIITLLVTALTGASVLLLARNAPDRSADKQQQIETQDVTLKDAVSGSIPEELQGAQSSLLVNGDIITKSTLKVAGGAYFTVIKSTELSANQTFTLPNASGTICLDSNNCNNASLAQLAAANARLATLQAQLGQLQNFVDGIDVTPTVPGGAGVDALNGQDGTVTIQGSLNQITVNTAGGVITLSTPQNLDANANVQFGSISSNTFQQTAPGNNVSISAGNDALTFTSGGRTFTLPAVGGASQTICTSAVTCAAGGGQALILGPGAVQTDSTSNVSVFINDTGGGNLIQIQRSSVDRFVLNNSGDLTISGSLTVQGLGNGFVRSNSGALSVVSALDLSTSDVTGTLPITRGGLGTTSLTTNGILYSNGSSAVQTVAASLAGQCLVSDGSGTPVFQSCPGASGVSALNTLNGSITLQGTNNQVSVNTGAGTITLSTPQNIHTGATPTFAGLTLTGLNGVLRASSGVISTGNVNLTSEVTGTLPIANGGTGRSTTPTDGQLLIGNSAMSGYSLTTLTQGAGITITNGNGTITIASPLAGTCTVGCADQALSNLSGVSINTSLLPNTSNTVNLGSTNRPLQGLHLNTTAGAQGFFFTGTNNSGTEVTFTLPVLNGTLALVQTAGASTAQTGDLNVTGSLIGARVIGTLLGSNDAASTSTITLRSGNASAGNSGSVLIDVGTATGTKGSITIGGSNASAITIGRSGLAVQMPGGLNTQGADIATANGNLNLGTGAITSGLINGQTIDGTLSIFTGDAWFQGNSITVGSDANNTNGQIAFISGDGDEIDLVTNGGNYTLTLPTSLPGGTSCLTLDNTGQLATQSCGSGLGGTGTDDRIPVFTSGGTQVADSVMLQHAADGVISVDPYIQIEGLLAVGTADGSAPGALTLYDNAGTGFAAAIVADSLSESYALKLPTSLDTTGKCLSVGPGGQLSYFACISSGGGGGGGSGVTADPSTTNRLARWVDGPNTQIGDSSIWDNGSRVGIGVSYDATAVLTVGSSAAFKVTNTGVLTVNGISNSNAGITSVGSLGNVTTISANGLISTSASGQAITASGAPTNSATQSLLQLGAAIAGGNNSANGGTYIGVNAPNTGAGSAADFINLQKNGSTLFRVATSGAVTAGTYNGLALQSNATGFQVSGGTASRQLTVTANATIDQNLAVGSNVSFGVLTLSTALSAGNGGTGLNSGPSQDGQLLIGSSGGTYSIATLTEGTGIDIVNGPGSITINAIGAGSCSTCANQDLGNLSNVAILGDDLKPATAGAINLGSSTKAFGDLYIAGTSSTPGTNRFRITGVATGSRTINLPDLAAASQQFGIVQTSGGSTPQTGDFNVSGSLISGDDIQATYATINSTANGNTALITASNNNASFNGNLLDLRYGNPVATSKFTVDKNGAVTIAGNVTANGAGPNTFANSIQVTAGTVQAPTVNATTAITLGGANINTAGTLSNVAYLNQTNNFSAANTFSAAGTALTVNNNASINGTATIGTLSVTNNATVAGGTLTVGTTSTVAGSIALYDGGTGVAANTATINVVGSLGQNTTYTLPDPAVSSAEVCVKYSGTSTNCSGIGGGISGSGTSGYIARFNGSNSLTNSIIQFSGNNLILDQGADRTLNIAATQGSGAGYNFTIQAGNATTTGTGGNLLLQAGAGAGGSNAGSVIVRTNSGGSQQQAFMIQDSSNAALLTADTTTNKRILIGTGTPSLATSGTGNLYVTNTVEIAGRLLIGTTNNGVDTTSGQVRYSGSFRNTKTIALAPEFSGMTLHADGLSNVGVLTSDYDSSGNHSYYNWTTSESGAQDYDMYVRIPVPRDFDRFNSGGNTNAVICYYVWTDDATPSNSIITAQAFDTGNVSAGTFTATPTSANTWQQKCSTTQYSFTTVTVNGNTYINLNLHFVAASGKNTRIGEITLDYLSSF